MKASGFEYEMRASGFEFELVPTLVSQLSAKGPMTSVAQVRAAVVAAVGPGTKENLNDAQIDAVVAALLDPLRRQGTLQEAVES